MRATTIIVALFTVAATLPAQESTRARRARLGIADTLYRDPAIAHVLGAVIPGAGHVYAGEYWNGLRYYYGTVAMLGAGTFVYILDDCTSSFLDPTPCKPGPAWPHQAAGIAMVALGAGIWIHSAIDAGHAAERANERHARKRAVISPFIAPGAEREGANVGLSLAW